MKIFTLVFTSLIFLISCEKQKSTSLLKFDVGKVKFEYPSDWKLTEKQGIDSYFSYLSKDDDTIYITYGMYNPKTYNNPIHNNLFKQITIDGREAVIETSQNEYGGFASIYIPKVDSFESFYMFNKKGNSHEILDIYKTFKLGNSTRKTPLNFNFKELQIRILRPDLFYMKIIAWAVIPNSDMKLALRLIKNLFSRRENFGLKIIFIQKNSLWNMALNVLRFKNKIHYQ